MEERAVIDRIVDGTHAVLLVGEGEVERVVPIHDLPQGGRPGSWLTVRFEGDRLVRAEVDPEAAQQASRRITAKMQRLRQRGRRL